MYKGMHNGMQKEMHKGMIGYGHMHRPGSWARLRHRQRHELKGLAEFVRSLKGVIA